MSKEQREKLQGAVERSQERALRLLDRAKEAERGKKLPLVKKAEKNLDLRDALIGILDGNLE